MYDSFQQGCFVLKYESNYLMHHGIRGQKWGVRRYQNEDGSLTAEGRQRLGLGNEALKRFGNATRTVLSKAVNNIKQRVDDKLDERNPSRMSDQELRDKLNRMSMEKQYKQLVKEMKSKPKKEHKILGSLLKAASGVLMSTATAIATTQLKVYSDDALAPKRMERNRKKGTLPADANLNEFRYFKRNSDKKK